MNTTTTFNTLIELQEYFKDEATCRAHLAHLRWGSSKPTCHHCGTIGAYVIDGGKRYRCCSSSCAKSFSLTTGTVFENTKLPLRVWFVAIYLCLNRTKGTSSVQLAKDLGITQKAAWFLLSRIRIMLEDVDPVMLTGMVEADEKAHGGSIKNKHAHERERLERNDNKTLVFGIVERGGRVFARPVIDTTSRTLQPILRKHVAIGSVVITDTHKGYTGVSKTYGHATVNHSAGEYVRGGVHTNTIEGFWGTYFSKTIFGTYHTVSPRHLAKYCFEICHRYNTRAWGGQDRHTDALRRTEGKRLRYRELIAPVEAAK